MLTNLEKLRLPRLVFILPLVLVGGCAQLFPTDLICDCPEIEEMVEEEEVASDAPVVAAVMKPIPNPDPAAAVDARADRPLKKLADGRLIIGAVETVVIDPPGIKLKARVDSGANTSSLDARDLVIFERDGKRWVRFKLRPIEGVEPTEIERPVKRFVRVSQTNSDEADRRPVVELGIELGGMKDIIDFNLRDRSQMTYPVLLGRRYLSDRALIDISRTNIQR